MGVKRKQVAVEHCKKPTILAATVLFMAAMTLIWTVAKAYGEAPSPLDSYHGTVAIDAGHGGKDAGSRGSGGSTEKEVCLAVARQLTHLLEPTYRVVLTRSDDYDMALWERTAIANHHKADLFISIHTAASYLRNTNGVCIYHYQPAAKALPDLSPAHSTAHAWDRIQMVHLTASQALAATLQSPLTMLPGQPAVKVIPAPLVVLQGADMPAVVIEVGYLTHPTTEEALQSTEHQAAIARAIAKGVALYLSAAPQRKR
jgi:N-acetylmuramoyl-L-alanine amidase